MRDRIEQPVAHAVVSWRSADQGGRCSGPPTARVYAATAVFPLGGESETQPGWPMTADPMLSVLLEEVPQPAGAARVYKIDFLVRDLAWPFLHPGAEMLITERPTVVASAVIRDVQAEDGTVE
jgi:hypothetical protein